VTSAQSVPHKVPTQSRITTKLCFVAIERSCFKAELARSFSTPATRLQLLF
jgi:hypothetical protein